LHFFAIDASAATLNKSACFAFGCNHAGMGKYIWLEIDLHLQTLITKILYFATSHIDISRLRVDGKPILLLNSETSAYPDFNWKQVLPASDSRLPID
jgi:hypothetical protein